MINITEKKYTLGVEQVLKQSSDWTQSRNGGDYSFYARSIMCDGVAVTYINRHGEPATATVYGTSAAFPYCEATDTFTNTLPVNVEGLTIHIRKDIAEDYDQEMTIEQYCNEF